MITAAQAQATRAFIEDVTRRTGGSEVSHVWQDRALCFDGDPAWWDTDDGGQPEIGTAICNRCLVREACLAAALIEEGRVSHQERTGIRAGTGPEQRAAMTGRARKPKPLRTCRRCDQKVREPHARYCADHRPADAEKRASGDKARRLALAVGSDMDTVHDGAMDHQHEKRAG